jgi:hypothetical protein
VRYRKGTRKKTDAISGEARSRPFALLVAWDHKQSSFFDIFLFWVLWRAYRRVPVCWPFVDRQVNLFICPLIGPFVVGTPIKRKGPLFRSATESVPPSPKGGNYGERAAPFCVATFAFFAVGTNRILGVDYYPFAL